LPFLSNFLEYEGNKFDSYTFANIGLELYEKYDIEDTNICDYPGKYGLIFQKAVTAWWRGNCMESRKIFQTLIDNHWDEMSEYHKTMVEKNVVSLGSGPPDLIFKKYDKSKHNKLRYKFKGSENIENNYSQIYQDLFILSMLNGKRNGSYLEIGGAEPYFGNNTCLLEKEFDWKGVSIEYDKKFIDRYTKERPNTNILNTDALMATSSDEIFNYIHIAYKELNSFKQRIFYLHGQIELIKVPPLNIEEKITVSFPVEKNKHQVQ